MAAKQGDRAPVRAQHAEEKGHRVSRHIGVQKHGEGQSLCGTPRSAAGGQRQNSAARVQSKARGVDERKG